LLYGAAMKFMPRPLIVGCLVFAGCIDGYVDEADLGSESEELMASDLLDTELGEELGLEPRWDPQSEKLLGAINGYDSAFAYDDAWQPRAKPDARGFTTSPPTYGSGQFLALTGRQSTGGADILYRVYSVGAADAAGRPLYRVQVRKSTESSYQEYCASPTAYAYAVQGYYDPSGRFFESNRISFACPAGAVTKAVRWNFAPGAIHPDGRVLSGARHLTAATVMARADYCGRGTSHTVAGTPIMFADVSGWSSDYVSTSGTPPGKPGEYQLEAAWGARDDGGEFGVGANALCISKWRYQTFKLDDFTSDACRRKVPDPRRTELAVYCDDLVRDGTTGVTAADVRELTRRGALMFSFSRVNDVGVWEWRQAGTGRLVTTDEGAYDYAMTTDDDPPAFPSYEGAPSLRGVVLKHAREGTRPLVLYRSWLGDYRTTTDDSIDNPVCSGWFCFSSWTAERTVGHVFTSQSSESWERARAVKLTEYRKGSDYRLFRSDEPRPTPQSGWTPVRPEGEFEGWALR